MATSRRPWTVLPHDPIAKLESNLWLVDGALPHMAMRRRMAIVRLEDGRLIVHSAMCLDDASMAEVDEWGSVAFILVPNGWHRIDAHPWHARYPNAKVICPEAARKRVEQVVPVHGHIDELPATASFRAERLDGLRAGEAVLHVRHEDRTSVVFCDAIMNNPPGKGFGGLVMTLMGSVGGPKVTPLMRLVGVRSKAAYAQHLRRVAEIDGLARLVPGHGTVLDGMAATNGILKAAAGLE